MPDLLHSLQLQQQLHLMLGVFHSCSCSQDGGQQLQEAGADQTLQQRVERGQLSVASRTFPAVDTTSRWKLFAARLLLLLLLLLLLPLLLLLLLLLRRQRRRRVLRCCRRQLCPRLGQLLPQLCIV